jgi:hypothetical protein
VTVLVCEDMALHRAMRQLSCLLDPTDEAQLLGMTEVISTRQLLEREYRRSQGPAAGEVMEYAVAADRVATEPLVEVLPGWKELSPASIHTLAQQGRDVHRQLLASISKQMTPALANLVRGLRVEEGFSWRAVARFVHDGGLARWPHRPDNQLAGMALCAAAAREFGEDYMAPPWNELPS